MHTASRQAFHTLTANWNHISALTFWVTQHCTSLLAALLFGSTIRAPIFFESTAKLCQGMPSYDPSICFALCHARKQGMATSPQLQTALTQMDWRQLANTQYGVQKPTKNRQLSANHLTGRPTCDGRSGFPLEGGREHEVVSSLVQCLC